MTSTEIVRWQSELQGSDPYRAAIAAERLADVKDNIDQDFVFRVFDKLWRQVDELGGDLMDGSGTIPRNDKPTAMLKVKGESNLIETLMDCRSTMVGVTMETEGIRQAYYVDTHEYNYDKASWTGTANCFGIYDILFYLQIWPEWFLPIQVQPVSHAVFIGPLVTVVENMIAECAIRIQSGLWEFVNNAASLNPDIRAWFGTLLQSNGNIFEALKTPLYVVMSNPLLDGSPLVAKTVRMQSCGEVIKELTAPYGVDVRVDLWLPGDDQPDAWANLDQPTYVVTVKDRSQIEGPTKTILDSVLRTVVDLGGSLGDLFQPVITDVPGMNGVYQAPILGLNFVAPYAILIAPDAGTDDKSSLVSCKIIDHTPKGWQHIIGGKSPKWLNDLINATLSWLIDSISIVIGITGIPSNLLDGFLNDAFLAFQLIELYDRRNQVGPYHPNIERFTATGSAPYNIEALFSFIDAIWASRGYTSALATFRNGDVYRLGKDIFPGGLVSIVYMGRKFLFTDYIENIMWKISPTERDVIIQVGDGKADAPPLARFQALITGLQESFNVLTLSPNNG